MALASPSIFTLFCRTRLIGFLDVIGSVWISLFATTLPQIMFSNLCAFIGKQEYPIDRFASLFIINLF
jgi:hypothetical protein